MHGIFLRVVFTHFMKQLQQLPPWMTHSSENIQKVEPSNFERTFRILVWPNNLCKKSGAKKPEEVHAVFFWFGFLFGFQQRKKKRHRKTHEFPRQKTPSPPAVALQGYQANLVPKRRFASAAWVQTTTPSAHHPRQWAPVDWPMPGEGSENW